MDGSRGHGERSGRVVVSGKDCGHVPDLAVMELD